MIDKFIFENEEQFDEFLSNVHIGHMADKASIKVFAKEYGYIRKSKLQTLADEAEKLYEKYINKYCHVIYENERTEMMSDIIVSCRKVIQAFKTKYPEWNK